MSRYLTQLAWLTLSALLCGWPALSQAAEAPGALTIIVKDQNTDRPLSEVQITLTERETSATQSFSSDAQGRIVAEQLDPGLYTQ
jgi:5-hydroxyisourate hydrolase-like protein (transthyretin family)